MDNSRRAARRFSSPAGRAARIHRQAERQSHACICALAYWTENGVINHWVTPAAIPSVVLSQPATTTIGTCFRYRSCSERKLRQTLKPSIPAGWSSKRISPGRADFAIRTVEAAVKVMHLRFLAGKSRVRFVVASIDHAGAAHLQPIAESEGRMVQVARSDADVIDLETTLDEVMKKDAGTELIECDREVNVLHLSGKRVAKRLAETGRPIDIPVTPGNKQRRKKRKSLDVIPMRVTEQDAATQRSSGFSQH